MTWLIEAAQINPGYGISRLTLRLHDKYPASREIWDEGKVNSFLGRYDHQNNSKLSDLLAVADRSSGRPTFHDPDGDEYVFQNKKVKTLKKKKPRKNDSANSGEFGGLNDAKQKIAYLLMKNFGVEDSDYYSSGSTVTLRYWKVLSEKLGIRTPVNPSKKKLVELIFSECQVDHEFNSELHTSSGSTITKTAFIDLCDHFNVNIPADLSDDLEEHEEDFEISLNMAIDPVVNAKMETVEDIINKFVGGVIYVPSFQRNFRWPIKKQRELIDSILLGIPLPSILLIKADDGDWWLVDGRQRVTSLRRFIKPKDQQNTNTFHLGLLSGENARYSNMMFDVLDEHVKKRILETKIPVTYIEGLSEHKSAIYELFRRYNTGGTNLNGAEIRHAVFHENECHMELFRLAGEDVDASEFSRTTKKIRKLVRVSLTNQTGFKAYDRICRYFGYHYSSKGMTTANAIFKFFEDHNDSSLEDASNLTDQFIQAAEFSDEIFGSEYRFNRLKEDGSNGGFGAWPYTIQMIGSTHILHRYPDELERIKSSSQDIIDLWISFYMQNVFNVRQNSTTLWNSQIDWCKQLDSLIIDEDTRTEYEIILDELHNMDPLLRQNFIQMLSAKKYFEKLQREAIFQGWIVK